MNNDLLGVAIGRELEGKHSLYFVSTVACNTLFIILKYSLEDDNYCHESVFAIYLMKKKKIS